MSIPKHDEYQLEVELDQLAYNDYIKLIIPSEAEPLYGYFKGTEIEQKFLLFSNKPEYDYIRSKVITDHLKLGTPDGRRYYRRRIEINPDIKFYKLSTCALDPMFLEYQKNTESKIESLEKKISKLVEIVNQFNNKLKN